MPADALVVRGARQHNLANIDVTIPRNRLVVITGPSGSGKSSLAFDTIYAEGQRRYVESLSTYARQFLGRMPKPDVDSIEGLSPSICIQHGAPSRNPRSTVGTVTELYDYLRLLYARVGSPHCPQCGKPVHAQTVQQMVDRILGAKADSRFSLLAPVARSRRGQLKSELASLQKQGFVRIRLDGEFMELADAAVRGRGQMHDLDVVVDRLAVKGRTRQRLTDSVELALSVSKGLISVVPEEGDEYLLSEQLACADCGVSFPLMTPRLFSFNSPEGACPVCGGLGERRRFEEALVVPDSSLSLHDGAVAPWGKPGASYHKMMLDALMRRAVVDAEAPWRDLPAGARAEVMHGTRSEDGYEGVLPGLERRAREYAKRKREEGRDEERVIEYIEEELGRFAVKSACDVCEGARLRPEARAVTVGGQSLPALCALPIRDVAATLARASWSPREQAVGTRLLREIGERVGFMLDVGLDYLSLDRRSSTLSGGEYERTRLATQIGSGLVGVLYVLDEPSVGLHPRDNERLLQTLCALRDKGNTVLVVEHDEYAMRQADHLIDMGPGAGRHGGRVVASGTAAELECDAASVTGAYLSGRSRPALPERRGAGVGRGIHLHDVRTHNLKNVSVLFPRARLVCVTGVSGSGKSSLVVETLLPAVRAILGGRPTDGVRVEGVEFLDRVIDVDQSPIGRTPRSNPATYTGAFGEIRTVFAGLPEARARGYKPGRFSFNVKGGRCEACRGDGSVRIEMHFLPDVYVQCEQCEGRRYNRETLEVRYRGHSVADVLHMTIEESCELLQAFPKIEGRLQTLVDVGLGYLELGQSATTLSGGEAQRVKLARELSKRQTGRTLYVLDEPTTGLHFCDVDVLLGVLQRMVDGGNTVVVIEHHIDVIRAADHVIDLGPEGGDRGGEIVAIGTPEEVSRARGSATGRYLRRALR